MDARDAREWGECVRGRGLERSKQNKRGKEQQEIRKRVWGGQEKEAGGCDGDIRTGERSVIPVAADAASDAAR